MENASKALLISAEILIGVLILTVAVIIITSYKSVTNEYGEIVNTRQVESFNNQFLKYIEYENGKMYIKAQDLITIKNLSIDLKDNNNIDVQINVIVDDFFNNQEKMYVQKDVDDEHGISKKITFPVYYLVYIEKNDPVGRITKINVTTSNGYYKYKINEHDNNIFKSI